MKTVAAITAVALSACAGSDPEISSKLTQQFINGSDPIDLSQLGSPTWERVCVLAPYTNNQGAEKVLGFKWNAEAKTSIASSDGINVLVFVHEAEVIAYVEHPRNRGDFSEMNPRCLSRSSAKVVRRAKPNGSVYLVAQNAA